MNHKQGLFIAGTIGFVVRIFLFGFCLYKITGNEWIGIAAALLYPIIGTGTRGQA